MLTDKQREILKEEIRLKKKAFKINGSKINNNWKAFEINGTKINNNYLRQTHTKAKERAKKALSDLTFLATEFPELVDNTEIIKLVESKLAHGKITLEDRKRKPAYLRKKMFKDWFKIGVLYAESGAPLIKPEINQKCFFAHDLTKTIHSSLEGISEVYKGVQILRFHNQNEKLDLCFSNLVTGKVNNNNTLDCDTFVEADDGDNFVSIKVDGKTAAGLKILIIEEVQA